MWKKLICLSFFFAFCTGAMGYDLHGIAFYVGAPNPGWYDAAQQNADVATIIAQAGYMFTDIQQFDDSQLTELGTWVDNNTNDGEMDILWLNGTMPSVLYPLANASPDGSRAELWLDGGNMIINVGDWFAYCTYEGGTRGGPGAAADNGSAGAGNILDLPAGVIASADGTRLPVTEKGYKYLPSLSLNDPFPTDRPVILSNVQAPWEVAEIFAGNATQLDPVVIHNTATDAYVAFINQATVPDDSINDRGVTCAEFIINWVGSFDRAREPDPPDGTIGWDSPLLTWVPGKGATFHDIYFGTNPTPGTAEYKGRQPLAWNMYWCMDPFVPGTTYYWRVDEVEADSTTIHIGDLWSFTAPPYEAYNPDPPDGARYVGTDADLNWGPGATAITHDVYFGTDETAVATGTGGTFKVNQPGTTYDPGILAKDTIYYWRIDEVEQDNTTKHTGDVWRFSIIPNIVVTDPDLVGWWTFDEGTGTTALDWSGHENHGILTNGAEWFTDGYDAGALHFAGPGYVAIQNLNYNSTGYAGVTACAWIRTNSGGDQYIISYDRNEYWRLEINGNGGGTGQVGWDVMTDTGQVDYGSVTRVDDGEWHHVAGVFDSGTSTIYIDGVPEPSATGGTTFGTGTTRYGFIGANSEAGSFNGSRGSGSPIAGELDDVRVYQKALTQAEIKEAMRGNPLLAWKPSPANASTPDIEHAEPVTWRPGDNAAKHDVYFGTDQDAVIFADSSDTTGLYRGRIDPNSYYPPEGVQINETYYWRIDEYNTDATISEGRIWSFTVADHLIIDDFEDYNDYCDRIFYTYGDGWGHNGDVACGVPPFGGNGTGSTVGYLSEPYAEQTITHGGSGQSMPMEYLNDGSTGKAFYSETQREFQFPQDFTRKGMKSLTLWFQGSPGSVGSFSYDGGTGIYTMTANGADIWYASDEFHYAYKQLSGLGTIEAQVLSITETNTWSKGGLMIRETLEPNSPFAAVYVTGSQGCRFQARFVKGENADSDTDVTELTHIRAPHWIKLERLAGGGFNAYDSNDPAVEGWHPLAWNTQTINMSNNVYIGLALTSHNTDPTVVCTAEFSDVATTGAVTGQWQSQDIGVASNDAERLYVALEDSTGTAKDVPHPDPNAVQLNTWQEWNIDLGQFSAAGVNLQSVKKIYVGVGDRNAPESGGSGMLYVDDIRLYQPRCFPDLVKPMGDFNSNCIVDYPDLDILAADWLLEAITVGEVAEVLFEAESADTIADPLQIWSDRADALGGKYVEVAPGNTDTGNPPTDGHATYVFNVTGGVYKILARTIAPSGSDDSFWLRIQDATTQTANHASGWVRWGVVNSDAWSWTPVRSMDDSDQTVHFTMAAGTYTMELAYREDGTLVDVFLITDDLDLVERTLLPEWVETDLNDDEKIDFKDYALLAGMWLDEELWP